MVPETYSEEANSNEYTGRPAGEMSLYTGSMNASESNIYRLRMYVTEEYNPQGDGGDLQFSVKINVYGKDGEKYVPLTTREILEDNPLQVEKENMFNYTADGIIIDNYDDWNMITNQEYITNGLYSMEDEDGTSYYFRGSNVNNYVQFGTYTDDYYVYRYGNQDFVTLESCQYYDSSCNESNKVLKYSAGTPMYWRIVRVNGDGSLRLIYNGTSTNAILEDLGIAGGFYNFDNSDPKYTGYRRIDAGRSVPAHLEGPSAQSKPAAAGKSRAKFLKGQATVKENGVPGFLVHMPARKEYSPVHKACQILVPNPKVDDLDEFWACKADFCARNAHEDSIPLVRIRPSQYGVFGCLRPQMLKGLVKGVQGVVDEALRLGCPEDIEDCRLVCYLLQGKHVFLPYPAHKGPHGLVCQVQGIGFPESRVCHGGENLALVRYHNLKDKPCARQNARTNQTVLALRKAQVRESLPKDAPVRKYVVHHVHFFSVSI